MSPPLLHHKSINDYVLEDYNKKINHSIAVVTDHVFLCVYAYVCEPTHFICAPASPKSQVQRGGERVTGNDEGKEARKGINIATMTKDEVENKGKVKKRYFKIKTEAQGKRPCLVFVVTRRVCHASVVVYCFPVR